MVKWRGQVAVYTTDEREVMSQLAVSEQALVHALKAFTDGEIQNERLDAGRAPGLPVKVPCIESPVYTNPVTGQHPVVESQVSAVRTVETTVTPPLVYTNPEDIEFGKPKRRKRIYALVTTWRQSCQVPTKREGEFWIKVWKLWHERQGWKVTSHPSGYFATDPAGARVAISLHEYDRETHERLN